MARERGTEKWGRETRCRAPGIPCKKAVLKHLLNFGRVFILQIGRCEIETRFEKITFNAYHYEMCGLGPGAKKLDPQEDIRGVGGWFLSAPSAGDRMEPRKNFLLACMKALIVCNGAGDGTSQFPKPSCRSAPHASVDIGFSRGTYSVRHVCIQAAVRVLGK